MYAAEMHPLRQRGTDDNRADAAVIALKGLCRPRFLNNRAHEFPFSSHPAFWRSNARPLGAMRSYEAHAGADAY